MEERTLLSTASLLKDINNVTGNADPASIVQVGSTIFFTANDGVSGLELWKTDGTPAGTTRVRDINPGSAGSNPAELTNLNGTLMFRAINGTNGAELWRSDGTEAGTQLAADIFPGTSSSNPAALVAVGTTLYFQAMRSTAEGVELWKSGGGFATLVKNINTSTTGLTGSSPSGFTNVNGVVYFAAQASIPQGTELWKTDGTEAGTTIVADLTPAANASSSPGSFLNVGGTLYFASNSGVGRELFKIDGTGGVVLVKDINTAIGPPPGGAPFGSNPASLVNLNGLILFTATGNTTPASGLELWKSDGTEAGTVLLKDIRPGSATSTPGNLTLVGSHVYLTAHDGTNGFELWKSDGTTAGTVMVKDLAPGATGALTPIPGVANLINVGGTLYFHATVTGTGTELYKSDGTDAGTVLVADLESGTGSSSPTNFAAVGGQLFFRAGVDPYGRELWKSDGTAAGTVLVKDIFAATIDSAPDAFTLVNGVTFFAATRGGQGRELWKSDGTAAGTVMVKDINPGTSHSSPSNLTNVGGTLYFVADDGVNGTELWKSDGTAAGTVMVKDINPDPDPGTNSTAFGELVNVNGTLYFAAGILGFDGATGIEVWKSDGTAAGTVMIKDINPGDGSSEPRLLTNVSGTLFFSAFDDAAGFELWKSDGTVAGTVMVKDIAPGADSSTDSTSISVNVNGTLFFSASDGVTGVELWKSDGTAAGTVLVKDINSNGNGVRDFSSTSFVAIGGVLYFAGTDNTLSLDVELWKSDGTAAGTVLVANIAPGTAGSDPALMTNVGGTLFFTAMTAAAGRELYKSDGTAAGTVLVKDIFAGTASSITNIFTGHLVNVGGLLYFAAQDGANGNELWKSDGTAAGTVLVTDINPGSTSSSPDGLINANGRLLFSAREPATGTELWTVAGTGDTVAPDTALTGTPVNPTNGTSATFTFTGTDDVTPPAGLTFECQLDGGGFTACTSPQSYSGLSEGNHTFQVRARDAAGNFDPTPASFTWVIDTAPPTVTLTSTPINPTNSTSASFSFSGSDPVSGGVSSGVNRFECSLDGAAFTTCTSPATYAVTEGSHTFAVRAVDNAGNIGAVISFTWVVDVTAPTVSLTSTPANPINSTSATFSFTATDPTSGGVASGVDRIECSLDGGAFTTCTSPASYTVAEGSHTFQVRAVDEAGNVGPAVSFTWVVDVTPPTATLTGTPANPTNSTSASFSFSGSDPVSGGIASGVNRLECSLDGAAFTTCTSPASYSVTEGSHTFAVRAVDNAGNVGGVANFSWIVDTTAPTASLTSTPANPTNSTSASFSFSATDPTSGGVSSGVNRLECSLDGAAFTICTSPATYAVTEGSHTFAVRAVDNAGNIGAVISFTWVVDVTGPVVSLTSTPANPTNSTSASFSFSASDPSSGGVSSGVNRTECSLDGGAFAVCTSPGSYSGLAEGSHTFAVRAVDNAGNVGAAASFSWVIDTTGPVVSFTGMPANPTNSTSASFTFSASDPVSGGVASGVNRAECSLDGGAFATCASPASYTVAEGSHTFAVRAVDNAGNTGAVASFTWVVDVTGPTATLTGTPANPTSSSSATFTFTATDPTSGGVASGVNQTECSLDGGAFAICTSPATYTVAPGSHTFQVRAVDNAGNTGAAASYTWTVTPSSAAVAITGTPANPTNSTSATFTFTTSGDVVRTECQLDGGAFATCTSPTTYSGLAEGSHTFTVRPVDSGGGIGTPASFTWAVDLTLPVATITGTPANPTLSTSAAFTFSAADPMSNGVSSGVNHLECSLDAAAFAPCTSPRSYTVAEGSHTFRVRAVDNAGNVGTAASFTWIVDRTDPTAAITAQPPRETNSTSATFAFTATDPVSAGVSSGVARTECRLDGAATFTTCSSPQTYTGLAEGRHTFRVRTVDNAGNVGGVDVFTWIVDRTAPTTVLTSAPADPTAIASARFTFTSTDPASGGVSSGIARRECSLDGGAFAPCSSGQTYTGLAEGTHTFMVQAVDGAGNVGPAVSHTWRIDRTDPVVTITSQPAAETNSTSAAFVFTATDPVSGGVSSGVTRTECSLNGAAFTVCVSPQSYTGLVEGRHNFGVRAVDNAGNVSTPVRWIWIIDTTPPQTTLTGTPANPTNSAPAQFTFTTVDPQSGGVASGVDRRECSLDGGAFAACVSPKVYTVGEGAHTFQVRAVDGAGNVGPAVSYAWVVDQTLPTAAITSQPANPTSSQTATFSFTAADPVSGGVSSGVARTECRLDGAAFTACSTPRTYTGLAAGNHTFQVRAVDRAGNVGTPAAFTWGIDRTGPTTAITGRPDNPTNSTSATFTYTVTDPVVNGVASGVARSECRLGGAAFAPCSSPVTYSGLTGGPHTFAVRGVDNVGNVGAPATYTWRVDRIGPMTTNMSAGPQPIHVGTDFMLRATVTDGGRGGSRIVAAEYNRDGGSYSAMTANDGAFDEVTEMVRATVTAPGTAGTYTYCVRGRDAAGNTGATRCLQVTVSDPGAGPGGGGGSSGSSGLVGALEVERIEFHRGAPGGDRGPANAGANRTAAVPGVSSSEVVSAVSVPARAVGTSAANADAVLDLIFANLERGLWSTAAWEELPG